MSEGEKRAERGWGLWFGCFAATTVLLLGGLIAVQIAVDPFGVWRTSATVGFNHKKSGQAGTERLFKVYQYILREPRVVFFGNSRGAWGLPPKWDDIPKRYIYNLSFDAQRVGDVSKLLRFMAQYHPPRTVVLNLDPIMMSNTADSNDDYGDFKKRLRAVSKSRLHFYFNKMKDTVLSLDALKRSYRTFTTSRKDADRRSFYDNGWFRVKGGQLRPHPREYRKSYWRYFNTLHKVVSASPSSVNELHRIVDFVRHRGIQLSVSFAPVNADYLLSFDAHGRTIWVNQIKRQIAVKTPFWDFCYINSVTNNRFNYIDSTHYRGIVGEQMLSRMSGSESEVPVPGDFGVWVTQDNIDAHIKMTMDKLAAWKQQHPKLVNMLTAAAKNPNEHVFETELMKLVPITR